MHSPHAMGVSLSPHNPRLTITRAAAFWLVAVDNLSSSSLYIYIYLAGEFVG